MSQDVLTVGSTMRIPLLYRREYSQWVERFMNYLEEQTNGEAMINSIKNGDQPLPRVTQVSNAGTSSTEQPPLKEKSMWSDQEKRIQKIDRLARSLLIQGLLNDIYSLIYSNKTAKDLWDALARHILGSEHEWKLYATMMRHNKNLMDINIDALYNILKQNQGDVNDATGSKKKTVVVTFDPLALIAEKTKVSKSKKKVVVSSSSEGSNADNFNELKKITALLAKSFNRRKFYSKPTNNNLRTSSTSQSNNKKQEFAKTDNKKVEKKDDEKNKSKEKGVVSSDSEGSDADDFSELKKITALLAKAFNRRKIYSKPTNNNLRTSSTSQFANKKQEFVKTDNKKVKKKDDEKKRDMSRVKCYNCKKEGHFEKDCKKVKVNDYEYYKTKMLLAKKDKDEQVLLAEDQRLAHRLLMKRFLSENFIENHIDPQKDYDKSDVDHNDSEEKDRLVDKLIKIFNKKIVKCQKRIENVNQQSKDFENQNKDLQDKYDVLKNQANTFKMNNKELNEQLKELIEKNNGLLAQTKLLKEQLQVKHVVIDTHAECQKKYAKHEAKLF
nr:hypothetical protein [Tanacetum cinerariifolium]